MKNLILFFLSFLFFLSCASQNIGNHYSNSLQYSHQDRILAIHLPDIPQLGSEASDSDFQTLHEFQKNRTKDECEAAKKNAKYGFTEMFLQLKKLFMKA